MILPIGHENSAVRRLPWVTWSLMVACLVALLATDFDAAQGPEPSDLYMEEAVDYFREHAYLQPDGDVRQEVLYDVMPAQRASSA
jgi:hypothetical protein